MEERGWLKRNHGIVAGNYACSICGAIFRPDPQDEWAMDVDFARHRLLVHRTNREEMNQASLIIRSDDVQ
jgi:hypothetical protein